MMSIVTVFNALWGIPFLQHVYHLSLFSSTVIVSLVMLGVACGSPLYGALVIRYSCRRLMLFGSLCSFVFISCFFYVPHLPIVILCLLSFVSGLSGANYLLSFTIVKRHLPESVQGTAMGFTNMLIMMMPIFFQPLMGFMLVHYHSLGYVRSYHYAMIVLPLATLVAAGLSYLVNDYPQSHSSGLQQLEIKSL